MDKFYSFYRKYERHLTTIGFLSGFIIDSFTLPYIEFRLTSFVLGAYLIAASLAIIIYNTLEKNEPRISLVGKWTDRVISFLPFIIQFLFGAILSGSLVFYSRSASLSIVWPFLIILFLFMVGNEIFRGRYYSFTFQISALFITSFMYASYATPFFIGKINVWTFLLAGLFSLLLISVVLKIIKKYSTERFLNNRVSVWISVSVIYIIFNGFYFLNLIPPLPLSLKEIGVYHNVSKDNSGNYLLTYEPAPWYYFRTIHPVFHSMKDNSVFVFSSVFAPASFGETVVHRWFYYNEDREDWVFSHEVSFPISGGRKEGYRGYSEKSNIFEGLWRVRVETEEGKRIGQVTFRVEDFKGSVLDLLTEVK